MILEYRPWSCRSSRPLHASTPTSRHTCPGSPSEPATSHSSRTYGSRPWYRGRREQPAPSSPASNNVKDRYNIGKVRMTFGTCYVANRFRIILSTMQRALIRFWVPSRLIRKRYHLWESNSRTQLIKKIAIEKRTRCHYFTMSSFSKDLLFETCIVRIVILSVLHNRNTHFTTS